MAKSNWLLGLRSLITIGRELRLLREAVERLADATEGRPATVPLPPAEPDALEIDYAPRDSYAANYAVEQRLRNLLGRDPTPEELIAEIDGEEARPDQPMVIAGRRRLS